MSKGTENLIGGIAGTSLFRIEVLTLLTLIPVVLLIFVVLFVVNSEIEKSSHEDAQESIQRAKLIWPDMLLRPEADRLVVARLARRCGLSKKPMRKEIAIECLRRGAKQRPVINVDGADIDSSSELERMLKEAPSRDAEGDISEFRG